MITKITDNVKITVDTVYQPEYSNPENEHFMFAYRIVIENLSEYNIRLLSRFWNIYDSNGQHRTIEGEGVVGQQPLIPPGTSYDYVSGCNLNTDMGYMEGYYRMRRDLDGNEFEVLIPRFELIAPFRYN